ncbi:LINE-1 retrotransposable element ORF2 protein isoform X1 [Amphiprion ocellaris]|uniref:LINE-1 retrotransposable element ORF2 protein isoform X1 n=1 Tax=Amphiprion ocellaris TaxID=80972 RepID=UPI0024117363|nr:LINE-1 retrotransposable element ORF2 protein isoform X1 [Amphiprion ocellaris]
MIKEEIKMDIKRYLEENDNDEVNPTILWDALKAVTRGKLFSKTAALKKTKIENYEKEKIKLRELENQHKKTLNPDLLPKLKEIRSNIDKIITSDIEKKTKFLKQSYYEVGPKAARLLARKLKKQQTERTIYKLKKDKIDDFTYEPKEIEKIFKNYYETLYTQPPSADKEQIKTFLQSLDLPSIGKKQNDLLTSPITKIEIENAVGRLKTNKMPGSDGLPSEWYKSFGAELIPLLQSSFNYTLEQTVLPPSWSEAIITVIPKKKKNETCADFRPISILNVDYKIYTSILAKRYEQFVGDLIDEDQTGFIKGRQTKDNIRRTLHIIDYITKEKISAVLVGLDAEKAFDSVNWVFLYEVLEKFGFNAKAVQSVKTLYQSLTARIKVNGNLTDNIQLKRSTRQGCSLSPTLFAIYIEPLAQFIRQNQNIRGIQIGNDSHVVGLFADDVICYLKDPEISFPTLIQNLEMYGFYSGYKLNLAKTQILTMNYSPSEFIRKKYILSWNSKNMSYLGVTLTKQIEKLYDANIPRVDQEIRNDIARWDLLTLDLSSRIEAIKTNVLPRLLYLFQALPIEIPEKQFRLWDKLISRFIWNGKKPRIKFEKLQIVKDNGGMALPNLKEYYHSAQLTPIMNWCDENYVSKWKNIEQIIQGRKISSILAETELIKNILKQVDKVTCFTLEMWLSILRKYNLKKELPLLQWPAYDKHFIPGTHDHTYKQLSKGITAWCVLIKNGNFKSFQELKQEFDLTNQDHFRYLQLRDFYDKKIKNNVNLLNNDIVKMIVEIYHSKRYRHLSSLYKHLMRRRSCNTLDVKQKWEKELSVDISEEEWFNIWRIQQSTTSSRIWREHCWKNIIRYFITPKITAKYVSRVQPCWRECGEVNVHHAHIFWLCHKLTPFWNDVHLTIVKILGYSIPNTCLVMYFGSIIINEVNKNDRYLLKILLAACKKAITKKWCKLEPPTINDWLQIVSGILEMEILTHRLRTQEEQCQDKWEKWTVFTSTLD